MTHDELMALAEPESLLDQRAETVNDRLWLVTNEDGSQEIVTETEKAGRGGFAPAYGMPYRKVLASMIDSIQRGALSLLEWHKEYLAGEVPTSGPLGGPTMPAVHFVAGGCAYTAFIGTHHKGHFLGYAGRAARITMTTGKVFESNNVWFGRVIPPMFRHVFKDTASINWAIDAARDGKHEAAQ